MSHRLLECPDVHATEAKGVEDELGAREGPPHYLGCEREVGDELGIELPSSELADLLHEPE